MALNNLFISEAKYLKSFLTSILIILVPANSANNSSFKFNGLPPLVRSFDNAPDILSALENTPGLTPSKIYTKDFANLSPKLSD